MYRKLVTRLSSFYVNCEQIRLCGLTKGQQQAITSSGYNLEFRKQLHQSLRTKLLQIVTERDVPMKERQLREAYAWFIEKLVAMGELSVQEQQAEFNFLNPSGNNFKSAIKGVIESKIKSALCNEDQMNSLKKAMYEAENEYNPAQRTNHPEIAPPEERIKGYKTKNFK